MSGSGLRREGLPAVPFVLCELPNRPAGERRQDDPAVVRFDSDNDERPDPSSTLHFRYADLSSGPTVHVDFSALADPLTALCSPDVVLAASGYDLVFDCDVTTVVRDWFASNVPAKQRILPSAGRRFASPDVMRANTTLFVGIVAIVAGPAMAEPNRPASASGEQPSTQVANALIAGHYARAVQLADGFLRANGNDPWLHYNRATALGMLALPDQAASEFRTAERLFGANTWGRSIAIYGRARAYDQAARCSESLQGYQEYAAFVRPFDVSSADAAMAYGTDCPARVGQTPIASAGAQRPAVGGGSAAPDVTKARDCAA